MAGVPEFPAFVLRAVDKTFCSGSDWFELIQGLFFLIGVGRFACLFQPLERLGEVASFPADLTQVFGVRLGRAGEVTFGSALSYEFGLELAEHFG